MAVTVRGTDILFNDGTTQSTAATADSRDFGGVGSYAILMNAVNSDLAVGGTISGSSLRYNYSGGGTFGGHTTSNASYSGGGSSVGGTWRKMSSGASYAIDSYGSRSYYPHLYVRIS